MLGAVRWLILVTLTGALSPVMLPAPLLAQETVAFPGKAEPGTIVVRTNERKLYYVVDRGRALRYPVGVGRAGKQWFGTTSIATKALRPAWSPPAEIRGNRPAWVIPSGSPKNPMGAAALVLADNELAIHGTNNPGSVGGFVSWGCIRMHNRDVMDLFSRVSVGTQVVIAH
jgi:lipoprotein-anchoring transpeptidase ErfK/SrfK